MVSTSGCAKADEVDLVGPLSPIIGVGDEEDIVVELVEWPRLKGSRVEYPMGCSQFREFCKAKSSVDGIWGHAFGYRAQFDYGLMLPLSNLANSVTNMIGACPVQLNYNFWEVIHVCETLNERWAASGSESRITAKDFLEYYAVKYVTATDGAYLSSSSSRPCFLDLSSSGRVWNDNLLWVSGECLQRSDEEPMKLNNRTITKVSKKESFIDSVAKEGTELEVVLKKLGINMFKRVASKDDKLTRLNQMPDGPVDMATMSSTVVQNLAKRKAVKRGAASRSATSNNVGDSSKRRKFARALRRVQLGLQDKSIKLERRISQLEGEKNQFEESLTREREDFQLELEKEREVVALKLKEIRAKSVAEAERLVSASATSRNNLAGKLYQLRYTKAEILAFSEGNYEEKEITDEEEAEEMEDGLNVAEKTVADNQETIDQKIESLCLRVVDLEGLLEVEKNSSADLQFRMFVYAYSALRLKLVSWPVGQGRNGSLELTVMQKELDVAREREEHTFLYNVEYAEEYEDLTSQYEDRFDDNVKLSLKLDEAKSQVEDKTTTLLCKDLALNQLMSELAELKERVASGTQHDAELAKYYIRALNDEISDMKCNIRALNEQLLKREIDLDTAQTNLAVSKADFEKLSSSIVGKDLELCNSAQIRDSSIARLDRLKADLRRLKEREAKNKADLAKVQAKNKSLVDDLAHVHGNVRRAVQRDKEMNERINQLCARITELERELRAREMKYEKDLKLELYKRDGEIDSGEGSRKMKEFLRQKEELVENMRIDLTNSQQKSIDLTRQMNERIDQLITKLAESKARRLRDNKRAAVTHQSLKELVVHEQDKYDGEALH
ncbi:hypothetical protein GIB67_022440 [Kingdonia uniflora]|uniref:Uncharacterized protein n=1 Tax=Kingdonia uniflora TaxID=39325 RepID=A0A7J7MUA9_9MAGN|nr:hypothetical protein GIB67_022440 [Kingdonia uniflora]